MTGTVDLPQAEAERQHGMKAEQLAHRFDWRDDRHPIDLPGLTPGDRSAWQTSSRCSSAQR